MNIIDTHAELPRLVFFCKDFDYFILIIVILVIYIKISLCFRDWPVGEYELRLFINDKLLHVAPFRIVEPPSS